MKNELSQLHPSNITTVTSVTRATQSGSHDIGMGTALCDCSLPPSLPGAILSWLTWFIFSVTSKPWCSIWPWERKTTEQFGLLSQKYELLYTFLPRWRMRLLFVYNLINDSWLHISGKIVELKGRQCWCRWKSEHDKVLKKGISTFDTWVDSWKSGHWFLSFDWFVRGCYPGQYQVGRVQSSVHCFQFVHGWKPKWDLAICASLPVYGEYCNQMTFFSCLMNWFD